jgi:phospholipase/carboxylesterase
MTALDGPRVPAAGGNPQRLVVLVHGFGADGNDLIQLAPFLQQHLPDAAFVAPHAPEACEMAPMGRQWFGLGDYDPTTAARDLEATAARYLGMTDRVAGAAPALEAFIDAELARHGLDDQHLALVGFSQGTMMSLHVGLRRARAPAAIVGFSGALVGADRLPAEITVRPPVLLCHGEADDLVPAAALHLAASGLAAAGLSVDWHVTPGLGHGIDPAGLELAGRFLAQTFAGRLGGQPPEQLERGGR